MALREDVTEPVHGHPEEALVVRSDTETSVHIDAVFPRGSYLVRRAGNRGLDAAVLSIRPEKVQILPISNGTAQSSEVIARLPVQVTQVV